MSLLVTVEVITYFRTFYGDYDERWEEPPIARQKSFFSSKGSNLLKPKQMDGEAFKKFELQRLQKNDTFFNFQTENGTHDFYWPSIESYPGYSNYRNHKIYNPAGPLMKLVTNKKSGFYKYYLPKERPTLTWLDKAVSLLSYEDDEKIKMISTKIKYTSKKKRDYQIITYVFRIKDSNEKDWEYWEEDIDNKLRMAKEGRIGDHINFHYFDKNYYSRVLGRLQKTENQNNNKTSFTQRKNWKTAIMKIEDYKISAKLEAMKPKTYLNRIKQLRRYAM